MPKYVVRHGVMRNLGVFSTRGGETYARSMPVIVRTSRGLEVGEVLCEATDHVVASMTEPTGGQILREQNEEDARELRRLAEQEEREFELCRSQIAALALQMKLIDVERLYGGERVVVYYLAEERIDFRQLVKDLAKEFQTRIEMRQIGVRDEAKLLADYGDCGKPVCCNTHLSEMPPVSMRMAKLQKATLDPSKISGRCGRLKCCLRYEYDTYQELQKDLPPIGAQIITNKGRAQVLAQEILAGQVLVQMDDMRRVVIDAAEVLTVLSRGGGGRGKSKRQEEMEPQGGGVVQAKMAAEGDLTEDWSDDSPLESSEG
jgi:cell fate regulator YaaT (PSP1 superfamily)